MNSTFRSLEKGFIKHTHYWSFLFGDGYELCFEQLLLDEQMYVALYKDGELLTEKVVVKPGK